MPPETTAQVGPMTTDELRDWHYRHKGLHDLTPGHGHEMAWAKQYWDTRHCRAIDKLEMHPYPPTLDGAASAMPEGFVWVREYSTSSDYEKYEKGLVLTWNAYGQHGEAVKCDDTGDEIHDRYLLAKLAKEAMNARPR